MYGFAQVAEFLNDQHKDKYRLFNLSERRYDYSMFEGRVVELGWPDHHAPPIGVAWQLCSAIRKWLIADVEHIAVVHCMAGKGRTGCIIASYDIFCGNHIVPPKAVPLIDAAASAAAYTAEGDEMSSGTAAAGLSGASQQNLSAAAKPVTTQEHVLQKPLDAATAALNWFGQRRGDYISQIGQKRAVLYTASIVHDCLARYVHETESGISADEPVQLQISVSATALHSAVVRAVRKLSLEDKELAHSMGVSLGLFALMSAAVWRHHLPPLPISGALVHVPGGSPPSADTPQASRAPSQFITARSIMMHGVPATPTGVFTPYIQILSLPSQAEASGVRLYYNSAWDTPKLPSFVCDPDMPRSNDFSGGVVQIPPWEAASVHYGGSTEGGPGGGHNGQLPSQKHNADVIITQQFGSAVAMQGDVLLRCLMSPGNTEVFRFSFHTAFLAMQPIPGVLRLTRDQLDVNKRNKKINKLPTNFMVDMFYTNEAVERAAAGSVGTAAALSLPVLDPPSLPPIQTEHTEHRKIQTRSHHRASDSPRSPQVSKVSVKSPVKRHFVAAAEFGRGARGDEIQTGASLHQADYDFSDDDGEVVSDDDTAVVGAAEGGMGGGSLPPTRAPWRSQHRASVLDARLESLARVPRSAVGESGLLEGGQGGIHAAQEGAPPSSGAAVVPAATERRRTVSSHSTLAEVTDSERQHAHAGVLAAANGTIRQGWMHKEGGFVRSWKQRYFVLRQGTLSYYSDMASGDAKGVIDLRKVVGVRSCRPDEVPGKKNCLKLLSDSGRTYIFQAPDPQSLEEWVVSLASVHGALMS